MASKQTTVNFILEQIADAGKVSARKMFGEYGIFCDGKMVALVCDDQLFVKPTLAGEEFIGECLEAVPYPGSKPCFLILCEISQEVTSTLSIFQKLASTETDEREDHSFKDS
jgi:TfoX/Sxy family transcriptional regulator of competence genes